MLGLFVAKTDLKIHVYVKYSDLLGNLKVEKLFTKGAFLITVMASVALGQALVPLCTKTLANSNIFPKFGALLARSPNTIA